MDEEDLAWDFLLSIADGQNCFSLHSEVSHPFPSFFVHHLAVGGHVFLPMKSWVFFS